MTFHPFTGDGYAPDQQMFSRILIFGDRNWDDLDFMMAAINKWTAKHDYPEVVIEGCARGADWMAGHTIFGNLPFIHTRVEHFPAKWDQHDSYDQQCWCDDERRAASTCRGAGPLRNQAMLSIGQPDAGIAFHKNIAESKGTADMLRRMTKAGKPVWIPHPQPQLTIDF